MILGVITKDILEESEVEIKEFSLDSFVGPSESAPRTDKDDPEENSHETGEASKEEISGHADVNWTLFLVDESWTEEDKKSSNFSIKSPKTHQV